MQNHLKDVEALCEAVMALRDKDECRRFLIDLCTVGELRAMAQRLHVARILQGKSTYEEIVGATKASTATISRVKKYLNFGCDGYKTVLNRLPKEARP